MVSVVGGGLAGAEAAWQCARAGLRVRLFEMRPEKSTPAHRTAMLAELVCSNSLGSRLPDRATGLLQAELRRLGSLVLACADACAVPAGGALAVDRERFARAVTAKIEAEPRVEIRREEVTELPEGPCVIATGPLTSDALARAIERFAGREQLSFFDAVAPIVEAESLDPEQAFRASRWEPDAPGDYWNCPLDRRQYLALREALLRAERAELRAFELRDARFFERCLPVEILAARGEETLRFGPMRPVGLVDPKTGKRPYAVVQLRQDDLAGSLLSLVGFQTNLRWGEQERVLRAVPGLARARFVRLGQMHRNTFVCAPAILDATLATRARPELFFAGQITGAEGYAGNAGTGLLAGINAARVARGEARLALPRETMLGALCHYLASAAPATFQPMKANFGILPGLDARPRERGERNVAYARRALAALDAVLVRSAASLGRFGVARFSAPAMPGGG